MRIKIINPNTTASFTQRCLLAGRAVAAAGTEILASHPSSGVPSVESHVDEATATLGVIEQVRLGEGAGVDGYVIACFGDTGLGAARELEAGPVVGMCRVPAKRKLKPRVKPAIPAMCMMSYHTRRQQLSGDRAKRCSIMTFRSACELQDRHFGPPAARFKTVCSI